MKRMLRYARQAALGALLSLLGIHDALAQNSFPTAGGATVPGYVNMCIVANQAVPCAAGGIAAGGAITGCTAQAILYTLSTLTLGCDAGLTKADGVAGLVTLGNGGSSTPQLTFTPNSGVNASWGMANSGTQLLAFGNSGATQFLGISGALVVPSNSGLKWSAGATVTSTNDTSISRASAGVAQIGTNTLGNGGSLNLTNLTAQGTLAATLGTAVGTNVVCNTPATASLLTVQVSATGCAASSARFKEQIASLGIVKALYDVLKFAAVSYVYKPEFEMGSDTHVGFTAEQVGAVDPQWITYEDDGVTPHAVKYNEMVPLLTAAIQALAWMQALLMIGLVLMGWRMRRQRLRPVGAQ